MRLLFEMDKHDYAECTHSFSRPSARSIIIRDEKVAMIHSMKYDYYKFPGGGIEPGEDPAEAMIRETREETGLVVRPLQQFLTMYEYYEEYRYISHYFVCEVTENGQMRLTEQEIARGLEPRWIPVQEAIDIYSRHQSYADVSEEKRGAYLREYTALQEYLVFRGQNG